MGAPRQPAADGNRRAFIWGLAGSSTVGLTSGVGAVLTGTYNAQGPTPATILLAVLSAIAVVSSAMVAIVRIRTDRSPEIRREERRTATMKKVKDPKQALVHDALEAILAAKEVDPKAVDHVLEIMQEVVGKPKETPNAPASPAPAVPAQLSDAQTTNDEQFREIVSNTTLEPNAENLVPDPRARRPAKSRAAMTSIGAVSGP
jgi:hypothetical protein